MVIAAGAVHLFRSSVGFASNNSVEQALALAESGFSDLRVRGDVAFWLVQGARTSGRAFAEELNSVYRDGEIQGPLKYDYYLWQQRHLLVPEFDLGALQDPSYDPQYLQDPDDGSDAQRTRMTLAVMVKAIDCTAVPGYQESMLKPDYGYVATHQLLGVLIAHRRGCLSEQDYRRVSAALLGRVVNEMRYFAGIVNDLQVERAAVLTLFGYADLVPVDMVSQLLESQFKTGLWAFSFGDRNNSNIVMHNSALAYMVLSGQHGLHKKKKPARP